MIRSGNIQKREKILLANFLAQIFSSLSKKLNYSPIKFVAIYLPEDPAFSTGSRSIFKMKIILNRTSFRLYSKMDLIGDLMTILK